jgi:hypothetical protein
MSLDRPLSDAEILAKYQQRTGKTLNGIELGPGSPVLERPAPRKAKSGANEKDHREQEHDIQVALFERVRDEKNVLRRPELAKVYAVPNGGYRTPAAARKLRAEGVEPGIPDVHLDLARGGWFGLRIEMKRPGGTLTPSQADRLATLRRDGYRVAIHDTVDGAWCELLAYIDLPPTVPATPPPPQDL